MAECSKGTNSPHGKYSHKYSENQYHSTTPCAPRCPSDRSLLRQRRTHLLHSTLLSPHPPGAHLREGRKVTSTGYSPLLIQIRSPIPERSSIDSVSQTSLPHDGSQQTRVGKCLAAHQAAPTQKATSRRAKTRGLALSKIIPNFAEQKGQLRPPKPQAGL